MKRQIAAVTGLLSALWMTQPDGVAPPAEVARAAAPHALPDVRLVPYEPAGQHLVTRPAAAVPGIELVPVRDPDIVTTPLTLAQSDLDRLIAHGSLRLYLPDGETLALVLERLEQRPTHQLLRVRTATGAGQFTRSEGGFFGTVAGTSAVYSIENQGVTTTIVKHSQLDQRLVPGLDDSRIPADA